MRVKRETHPGYRRPWRSQDGLTESCTSHVRVVVVVVEEPPTPGPGPLPPAWDPTWADGDAHPRPHGPPAAFTLSTVECAGVAGTLSLLHHLGFELYKDSSRQRPHGAEHI